jgi:hypothetical protein
MILDYGRLVGIRGIKAADCGLKLALSQDRIRANGAENSGVGKSRQVDGCKNIHEINMRTIGLDFNGCG